MGRCGVQDAMRLAIVGVVGGGGETIEGLLFGGVLVVVVAVGRMRHDIRILFFCCAWCGEEDGFMDEFLLLLLFLWCKSWACWLILYTYT